MQVATTVKTWKLDPCPAQERVCEFYDIPHEYQPAVKTGAEGEVVGEDGVRYQKCGGGRRVLKKKIGGN